MLFSAAGDTFKKKTFPADQTQVILIK